MFESPFQEQQRNVVAIAHVVLKADVGGDGVDAARGSKMRHELVELRLSSHLGQNLEHAIGGEQQAARRRERDPTARKTRARKQPERATRTLEHARDFPVVQQREGELPCAAELELVRSKV